MLETSAAQLGGAKLLAATASPIGWLALAAVGGFVVWQQWRGRQELAELRVAVTEERALAQRLDGLAKGQRDLSERIQRLHQQLDLPAIKVSNEAAKPTQQAGKLAMLKRLVDDNVNLREQLKK